MPTPYLQKLKKNWNKLADEDALWAILSDPTKKHNKWQLEEFFKTGEKEISNVFKELESLGLKVKFERCLDFGCGAGRLTQALGNFFNESIGIDISEKMIELAKAYNSKTNCKFFVNEDKNLSLFSDGYFDFIYSSITFQHIYPTYALTYLRACLKKLVTGGVMVFQITTKEKANPRTYLKNSFPRLLKIYRLIKELVCADLAVKIQIYFIKPKDIEQVIKQEKAEIIDRIDEEVSKVVSSRFFVKKL
ncbi:MAG: class I SAM-dependent methyltransferase [Candidatus Paceibacterota bacterium]|jgi:ubiquinone/menaquinone biosynthesis C-methylase UbiE